MRNVIIGCLFSSLLIISYLLLRITFSLWESFSVTLILFIVIFSIFSIKSKQKFPQIFLQASYSGVFWSLFTIVGIMIFPPSVTRDMWDIIIPYMNSVLMGFFLTISLMIFGYIAMRLNNRFRLFK